MTKSTNDSPVYTAQIGLCVFMHVRTCMCVCVSVGGCVGVYVFMYVHSFVQKTYIASYHEGHSDELSAQPLLCLGMPGCVMYVCVLVCMCIREYLYLYVCEFSM